MTNKPKNLTPKTLSLVRDTIRLILSDEVITEKEMEYVVRLYNIVFETKASKEVMINDLTEVGKWTIKDVR